jgi:hypothetical protein
VAVQGTSAPLSPAAERAALRKDALTAGLAILAAYDILLAAFMAAAPHAFYAKVGPFGTQNDHYIRDIATFSAAIGVGALVALRSRAWRVPVLTISVVQFALHSVNHLVDIGNAHPRWNGYFDFASLTVATILLALLLRIARADANGAAPVRMKGAT